MKPKLRLIVISRISTVTIHSENVWISFFGENSCTNTVITAFILFCRVSWSARTFTESEYWKPSKPVINCTTIIKAITAQYWNGKYFVFITFRLEKKAWIYDLFRAGEIVKASVFLSNAELRLEGSAATDNLLFSGGTYSFSVWRLEQERRTELRHRQLLWTGQKQYPNGPIQGNHRPSWHRLRMFQNRDQIGV